jgi:hypothetical protein
VETVPLLNLWTLWWNVRVLETGLTWYWDAPIFYPEPKALACSEPQPILMCLAPVLWAGGTLCAAYNLAVWLNLTLNGVLAARLLSSWGIRAPLAVVGGMAVVLLPIIHWQRGVLQFIPVWAVLWTWDEALRFRRQPSGGRGALVGLAFGTQVLLSVHQALLLGVLLVTAVCWWMPWGRWSQAWRGCLASMGVVLLVGGPVIWPMSDVASRMTFRRSLEAVSMLSALPADYLTMSGGRWLGNDSSEWLTESGLSPGWLRLALAGLGAGYALSRRRWRTPCAFLLFTGGVAWVLSLGTNLRVGSWVPWVTLATYVPGLSLVRNVFRFAYFVQLVSVLLAVIGLHSVSVVWRRSVPAGGWRRFGGVLLAALAVMTAAEVWPRPVTMVRVPDASRHRRWIGCIQDELAPGRAVVCLPMPAGDTVHDFASEARWMYLATFHGAPLVNGYSGFFPRPYDRLRRRVNSAFPGSAALEELRNAGVDLVVVDRVQWRERHHADLRPATADLELLVEDDVAEVDVYRLRRGPTTHARTTEDVGTLRLPAASSG